MSDRTFRTRRTVLRGGSIRSDTHPGATAMCTEGGTILRIGSDAELAGYVDGADMVTELAVASMLTRWPGT